VRNFLKRCRCEDGQALVELAFVLPLVLLFLFGIIDFGLALNSYNGDTNIANIAARTASVMGTTTSVTCAGNTETTLTLYVDCEASSTGAPTPTSVCVADMAGATPSGTYTTGDPIKVEVTSTFHWLQILTGKDSYIAKVVNPTSSITASATMRLEAAPTGGSSSFLSPTCTS